MNWMTVLEFLAKLDAVPGLSETCRKLIEWIFTKVCSEISILRGVEEEIEELKRTHRYIQRLLADAEDRRYIEDETVKQWLLDLESVGFDADDLIDRYQTPIDISRLAQEVRSRKRKRNGLGGFLVPSPGSYMSLLCHRYSVGPEIANIKARLEEIHSTKNKLRLKPSDGKRRRQIPMEPASGPVVQLCDESKIVGRDKDCKSIVDALKSECAMMLPVILIYGVAGIGKTTLAQLIFKHFLENDEGGNFLNPKSEDNREITSLNAVRPQDRKRKLPVGEGFFALKIWASLPKGCDVTRATREIIEGITKRNCMPSSLNILQHHLKGLVEGRKFLLVLDNFWAQEYGFWETLRLPLLAGAKGSKVLITTRNELVRRSMGAEHVVHLQGLRHGDCWKLLADQAFPHCNGLVDEKVEDIGMKIVRRCQGSPLAALCLGKILFKNTDAETWRGILEEMWALTETNNQILSSLLVSYHHLEFPMKRCLAYCSVLPNGYEFGKDELVNMWIAEGLVQRKNGRRALEAIGRRYFDHLLWTSFFEISTKHKDKYRMPSLIHDLARHVSEKVMVILEDNNVIHESSQQPRYATLFQHQQHPVSLEKLFKYRHLRALKLYGQSRVLVGQIPHDLFVKLKFLRLLDLSNSDIEELPESVGDLIHLRYLGLADTNIKQLPESTSKLYNLKTLDLSNCYNLSSLPQGTSNLINLRHLVLHLDWDNFSDFSYMPPGICHLTSLQTLSRFTVNRNQPGDGCNIGELKELNLRGELCICKLENIAHASDAKAANLITKDHVNKLMLRWSDGTLPTSLQGLDMYQEVADGLHPQTDLAYLSILNYPGKTFSSWLEDPSFSYLETVTLSGWQQCETLPSLGQLPRLKHLHVERMNRMETLGNFIGFPSLVTLTIKNMRNLQKLFKNEAGDFPNLCKLSICRCIKFRELMKLPPTVELRVEECDGCQGPRRFKRNWRRSVKYGYLS